MLRGELFSTDMVRAYLEGRKLHTARPAKIEFLPGFNPEWSGYNPVYEYGEFFLEGSNHRDATKRVKPRHRPGDYIYCRETFYPVPSGPEGAYAYKADGTQPDTFHYWTPSIHMPREAARLFFRVAKVEVMRLEDVTEEFAWEDGFTAHDGNSALVWFHVFWQATYGPNARWMWVYWTELVSGEEAAMPHEYTVYTRALSKWGAEPQTRMVYEEMAELQKELCKHARVADNRNKIAEEIADVLITLEQMMVLHNCEETVADMKCAKLERLVRRINE